MSSRINKLIATVGGIGYLPLAPGTWAAGFLTIIWFFVYRSSPEAIIWQIVLIPSLIAVGIYSSGKILTSNGKDPTYVVIDEVAGMAITLLLVPASLINCIVGFILFRLFDILKPLGIRKAENFKRGWGIMLDDILAGIYSNLVLRMLIFSRLW